MMTLNGDDFDDKTDGYKNQLTDTFEWIQGKMNHFMGSLRPRHQ